MADGDNEWRMSIRVYGIGLVDIYRTPEMEGNDKKKYIDSGKAIFENYMINFVGQVGDTKIALANFEIPPDKFGTKFEGKFTLPPALELVENLANIQAIGRKTVNHSGFLTFSGNEVSANFTIPDISHVRHQDNKLTKYQNKEGESLTFDAPVEYVLPRNYKGILLDVNISDTKEGSMFMITDKANNKAYRLYIEADGKLKGGERVGRGAPDFMMGTLSSGSGVINAVNNLLEKESKALQQTQREPKQMLKN